MIKGVDLLRKKKKKYENFQTFQSTCVTLNLYFMASAAFS